jgi:hypothetical protein
LDGLLITLEFGEFPVGSKVGDQCFTSSGWEYLNLPMLFVDLLCEELVERPIDTVSSTLPIEVTEIKEVGLRALRVEVFECPSESSDGMLVLTHCPLEGIPTILSDLTLCGLQLEFLLAIRPGSGSFYRIGEVGKLRASHLLLQLVPPFDNSPTHLGAVTRQEAVCQFTVEVEAWEGATSGVFVLS